MTEADIVGILEDGLSLVSKLAPLVSAAGPTGAAIGALVGQIASTADTLLAAAQSDATIIASGNLANIEALAVKLQASNKQLAAQIASS